MKRRYTVTVGNLSTRHPDKTRTFVTAIHANHYARNLKRARYKPTVQRTR